MCGRTTGPCSTLNYMLQVPDGIEELAESQLGIITRQQALRAGLTGAAIRARVDGGRWQRIYFGVFAMFSGEPGRGALLWAAVLRAGPGATLSHQTAAELHGITRKPSELIHVTIPDDRRVYPVPGLVVHLSGRILAARHPSQTPPRTRIEETVLDLAEAARNFDDALGWVCAACGGRRTTSYLIRDAMSERQRLRFREGLEMALDDIAAGAHTVLEHRYLGNVERRHGLPRADRQVRVTRGKRHEYRDALYTDYQVAVETDGQLAHSLESRWSDAHRDNAAAADGTITLRYSWSDVTTRPCYVAAEVAAVLSQRGWPGRARPCGPGCAIPGCAIPGRASRDRASRDRASRDRASRDRASRDRAAGELAGGALAAGSG
jgi:very-short-patch-repair endonuclease